MRTLARLFLTLLISLNATGAMAAADDAVVGMVLDVQGPSQLVDRGNSTKLQLLTYVKPQMQIKLAAGSKASLSLYATHAVYQMTGPSVVEISKDKLTVIEGNAPTTKSMTEKLVVAAQNTNILPGAFRMRSIAKIEPTRPEKGSVLLMSQPTFSWNALEDATYDVSLAKLPETLITSAKVQDTSWTLPANVKLDYGTTYRWTVSYTSPVDGKVYSSSSDFNIISKADSDMLAELKPADSAPIEEWILYASVLQNRQIREEARRVWGVIAKQRTDLVRAQELAR